MSIISVENLGKKYTLRHERGGGGYRRLSEDLIDAIKWPFRRSRKRAAIDGHTSSPINGQPANNSPLPIAGEGQGVRGDADNSREDFWALKDVSFEVKQGEVLGIIGRNGAGKSTLLKILSRITEPTEGRVSLRGRVASLLEVGTGFHPELTGRENIFLNGAILGMSRAEIRRKFDEIVSFAGVEKFLDTAVKRYSSGMYVRLAFAVAAHLEPEVLVVDEVLAVGDAEFQKKCLGKMSEVAGQGRTVLFVSHNMLAVHALCNRAIMLELGTTARIGRTNVVVEAYSQLAATELTHSRERAWKDLAKAPGNDRIRVLGVAVRISDDPDNAIVTRQSPIAVELHFHNARPNTKIIVNMVLYTADGAPAFESLSTNEPCWHGREFPIGNFRSVCEIPGNLLNEGAYRLRMLFLDDNLNHLFDFDQALTFIVHDAVSRDIPFYGRFCGPVHPELKWTAEQVVNGQ